LLEELLQDKRTWEDAMTEVYGPLRIDDKSPILVWTDGSCLDPNRPSATAGSGVFWGPDSERNRFIRLPGAVQTSNRAELLAMLVAIDSTDPLRALVIYSDSEYAIRSVAEWAPARADTGWTCKNGDLLQRIQQAIQRRLAMLHLVWIPSHSGNAHNDGADALAKKGAA
ncbi:ribonuclease H-like protein, partial [Exidia glandulosa HHB12029]